jgi:hypothetical protein
MQPIPKNKLAEELEQLRAKLVIIKFAYEQSPIQFRTHDIQRARLLLWNDLYPKYLLMLDEYIDRNHTIKILIANEIEFEIINGQIHI